VKICDFNLSRVVQEELTLVRALTHAVCTRWYRPPEVILFMDYTKTMDVWSMGCILVELFRVLNTAGRRPQPKPLFQSSSSYPLSGERESGDMLDQIFDIFGTPFEDAHFPSMPPSIQNILQTYRKRSGSTLKAAIPREVPPQGLDLASQMLRFFPDMRMTAEAALQHPFFEGADGKLSNGMHTPERLELDLGFDDAHVTTSEEVREEMQKLVGRLHNVNGDIATEAAGVDDNRCSCCQGSGVLLAFGSCPLCDGAGFL